MKFKIGDVVIFNTYRMTYPAVIEAGPYPGATGVDLYDILLLNNVGAPTALSRIPGNNLKPQSPIPSSNNEFKVNDLVIVAKTDGSFMNGKVSIAKPESDYYEVVDDMSYNNTPIGTFSAHQMRLLTNPIVTFKTGDKVIYTDINGVSHEGEIVSGPRWNLYTNRDTYEVKIEDPAGNPPTLKQIPHNYLRYPGALSAPQRAPTLDVIDGLDIDDSDFFTGAPQLPIQIKCECGSDSVGGGLHSTWCPKADR